MDREFPTVPSAPNGSQRVTGPLWKAGPSVEERQCFVPKVFLARGETPGLINVPGHPREFPNTKVPWNSQFFSAGKTLCVGKRIPTLSKAKVS